MRKVVRKTGRAAAVVLAAAFGYAAYIYVTLPDVRALRTSNPDSTAFQRLRAREARTKGQEPRRVQHWVTYGQISPHLIRAVLAAEDSKFWRHEGVDFDQIKESVELNIERRAFARGASTITQQLAKNLYLSPSKNPIRKIRELLIARRLEAELPKHRILELYLNTIEWGDGIYGAEAAARTHLRKSASQLSPREAALLAAAIVSPRVLDPGRPSARLRRRQEMIARRVGVVGPPPLVVAPAAPGMPSQPVPDQPVDAVPAVPVGELPAVLPGEIVTGAGPAPQPCEAPPCR